MLSRSGPLPVAGWFYEQKWDGFRTLETQVRKQATPYGHRLV
jgi:hypothetical protein